jgi:hypothetical protein
MPSPFPTPEQVRDLCRKFGVTIKPPLTQVQLNKAEHGKQSRRGKTKINRYLNQLKQSESP